MTAETYLAILGGSVMILARLPLPESALHLGSLTMLKSLGYSLTSSQQQPSSKVVEILSGQEPGKDWCLTSAFDCQPQKDQVTH